MIKGLQDHRIASVLGPELRLRLSHKTCFGFFALGCALGCGCAEPSLEISVGVRDGVRVRVRAEVRVKVRVKVRNEFVILGEYKNSHLFISEFTPFIWMW